MSTNEGREPVASLSDSEFLALTLLSRGETERAKDMIVACRALSAESGEFSLTPILRGILEFHRITSQPFEADSFVDWEVDVEKLPIQLRAYLKRKVIRGRTGR